MRYFRELQAQIQIKILLLKILNTPFLYVYLITNSFSVYQLNW
jgi:hypothetical protein